MTRVSGNRRRREWMFLENLIARVWSWEAVSSYGLELSSYIKYFYTLCVMEHVQARRLKRLSAWLLPYPINALFTRVCFVYYMGPMLLRSVIFEGNTLKCISMCSLLPHENNHANSHKHAQRFLFCVLNGFVVVTILRDLAFLPSVHSMQVLYASAVPL